MRRGFSLLELLVVVAILSTLAGALVYSLGDVETEAARAISQTRALELREAILRFRRDTGAFPGQGIFALEADGGLAATPAGPDLIWEAAFRSPASLIQLFEEPVRSNGLPVMPWNADSRRGWQGPYLARAGRFEVALGDALAADGTGDPRLGSLVFPSALLDAFEAPPQGSIFAASYGGRPMARVGRPYLIFWEMSEPQILSLGPNGAYESGGGDDLVVGLR